MGLFSSPSGALVILSYYNVIPSRFTKWWPVLIIALGILMLLQHYWRELRKPSGVAQVLDPMAPRPFGSGAAGRNLSPPLVPIIIVAGGVYLLLRNFHEISLGVVLAVVLILVGALFLTASVRGRPRV